MSRRRGKAGEERRQYPRKLTNNLRLCNPIGGKVGDLSDIGMVVTSNEVLAIEKRTVFTLARNGAQARIEGVVKWCRLFKTEAVGVGHVRPVYRIGVAFDGPVTLDL